MKRYSRPLSLIISCLVVLLSVVSPALSQETPPQTPIDQLDVINVLNTDLMAGPGRTSAFLAPSGKTFAHISDELCLYDAPSGVMQRCITLSEEVARRIDNENVRWSPDERYLVLGQEALRTLRDPDLVILDTETGSVTNITDDGYEGGIFIRPSDTPVWIDLSPRWTPEGTILFLRTTQEGTDLSPTTLYRIGPDGSGLEQLATLPGERVQVWWFNLSSDGQSIVYAVEDRGDLNANPVYISDLDGSNAHVVFQSDYPVLNATFSPDGRYLLTLNAQLEAYAQNIDDPAASPIRIVDLDTGRDMPVDNTQFVQHAGWAHDGHALAYLTRVIPEQGTEGLLLTPEPGQPGRLVLEGRFFPPTSLQLPPIPWGANHVLLLSSADDTRLRVIQLGEQP